MMLELTCIKTGGLVIFLCGYIQIILLFCFHSLLTFNYLANIGNKPCPLSAAMCICMLWDLMRSNKAMERPLDKILFNLAITKDLCHMVERNAELLSASYDVEDILKVGSSFNIVVRISMNDSSDLISQVKSRRFQFNHLFKIKE